LAIACLISVGYGAPAGPEGQYGPLPQSASGPGPLYTRPTYQEEDEQPVYRRQFQEEEEEVPVYRRQGYEEEEAPVYRRQAYEEDFPRQGYQEEELPIYRRQAPYVKQEEPPKPYAYEYGVQDSSSGAAFTKSEIQNEVGAVQGSYKVHLPDGRIQTVTYHADADGGFVADVSYEGTPQYPEEPVGGYGQPKHRPPPGAYPNRARA